MANVFDQFDAKPVAQAVSQPVAQPVVHQAQQAQPAAQTQNVFDQFDQPTNTQNASVSSNGQSMRELVAQKLADKISANPQLANHPTIQSLITGQPAPAPKEMSYSEALSNAIHHPLDFTERFVKDIPHQVSTTARAGLEGLGQTVDFLTTPLRYIIQKTTGTDVSGGGKAVADYLGLDQPRTSSERVASGAEQLVAGGGGMVGAASKAAKLAEIPGEANKLLQITKGGTVHNALKAFAANPETQAAVLTGSGTASSWVKEEGGPAWLQLIAGLGAGITTPGAIAGTKKLVGLGPKIVASMRNTPNLEEKVNTVINAALESKGVNPGDISGTIRIQLADDMRNALKQGEMSPDVVRRLVDYRLTGLTPTKGTLTLDPGQLTREKNLAALGANSTDPELQQLSQIQNANRQKLIDNMNNLGAAQGKEGIEAGQKVVDSLKSMDEMVKSKVIDPLYAAARESQGRQTVMSPSFFTNRANDLLDEKLLGGALPDSVRTKLNGIAEGKIPLTVDVAEQMKTAIGNLQRATNDGQTKMALGVVRQALEETPVESGGQDAINAFNKARAANRQWMTVVNKTPALEAVREGVEPDKFMETYIVGNGTKASLNAVSNLKEVIKNDGAAMSVIRNYIARYLKEKALSGNADEVGNFSQSRFNAALKAVGDKKLSLFFDPHEVAMLKAIGRVSSYEQFQPTGSAVNNSKTAGTMMGNMLDWLGSVKLLKAATNIGRQTTNSFEAANARKVPVLPKPKPPKSQLVPVNALASGLIATRPGGEKSNTE